MDLNKKWMTETAAFEPTDEQEEKDFSYLEAVGSLLYLSQISSPDSAYPIGVVSSFSKEPKRVQWQAVKRIFRYLKGTINFKLVFKEIANFDITGFSDAD